MSFLGFFGIQISILQKNDILIRYWGGGKKEKYVVSGVIRGSDFDL